MTYQTIDMRDKECENDVAYYLTADHDLVRCKDVMPEDDCILKVLVNSLHPGTQEEWESNIKARAINFLKFSG